MTYHRLTVLALLALLSACDGGGGDHFRLPDTQLLSTPTTLQATAKTDGIDLSWQAVAGVASYALYRCPVPAGVTNALCDSTPTNVCGTPIARTTGSFFTDVPPLKAPDQAYCYRVSSCTDASGQLCGPVVASVASAQRVPAPVRQMSTVIGDDGRHVISGLTTTLHAFADGATGNVIWNWTQESGPRVTLVGADTPDVSFVAPVVAVNTLLSFELRVMDDNGPGRPSKLAVTVVPASNVIVKTDSVTRQVQAGHEVSLHARGSNPNLLYSWRQLSPATPQATLTGADTDNPSFIAPVLVDDTVMRFEVTATDAVTGRNASARTGVEVLAGVPAPPGALPVPLQLAQPQPAPLHPTLPVPQAVPIYQVPPQNLLLLAAPEIVAVGGTEVDLAMAASGGVEPYQWSWMQTSGPAATLINPVQDIMTVQLPVVASAQALTFEATLTDANGTTRTATAVVHAILPPQQASGYVPTPLTALAPRTTVPGEPLQVSVALTGVTVTQNAGPALAITPQPTAAGSVVTVTAPSIRADSQWASFTVTGADGTGQTVSYLVPVLILRPPSLAAAPTEPPQVLPTQVVPRPNDPLVIAGRDQAEVDEGRSAPVGIGYAVKGGRGSADYVYTWDYLRDPGGPDVTFAPARSFVRVTVPAVDRPTDLKFRLTVSDGAQQAQRTFTLRVNDLAPTLVVGAATSITVHSGHFVTLSMPTVSGGLPFARTPPYDYSVSQISGTPVLPLPLNGRPGNFGLNAPALAPGAADEVIVLELTATDRIGNEVKLTQQVTVTAPPASQTPLVAGITAPELVRLATASLTLQGTATGGTAPYIYAWTIHPEIIPADGHPPFTVSDIQATGTNPTVMLPSLISSYLDIKAYSLQVTLTVTDANSIVATAAAESKVIAEQTRQGGNTLLCGNFALQSPCTDLDLVLAITSQCPNTQPYAMNELYKTNGVTAQYRSCVDALTAYRLWVLGSSKNAACLAIDPAAQTDLQCHIACYGDDCNINVNPPANTLVGPPGPDGRLTVGGCTGIVDPANSCTN